MERIIFCENVFRTLEEKSIEALEAMKPKAIEHLQNNGGNQNAIQFLEACFETVMKHKKEGAEA